MMMGILQYYIYYRGYLYLIVEVNNINTRNNKEKQIKWKVWSKIIKEQKLFLKYIIIDDYIVEFKYTYLVVVSCTNSFY